MNTLNKTILLCLSGIASFHNSPYALGTLFNLCNTTCEKTMITGGDDRIAIKQGEKKNRFLTSPSPELEAIVRSSSTSCSSSVLGFHAAQQIFDQLQRAIQQGTANNCFSVFAQNIRNRIRQYWGASSTYPCNVILSPSGTDAEFIPTLAALTRHPHWNPNIKKKLVTNIVVANGEVGSGTTLAAGMRHFSSLTPQGNIVVAGALLSGVSTEAINVIGLKIRNESGVMIPAEELENEIFKILHQAIDEEHGIAILHMTHVSKTGLSGPRESFVKEMKVKYDDSLLIVVDAAHLRFCEETSRRWLDSGYWILLTGSKFIGGASFSGALLIPHHDAKMLASIESTKVPAGLGDYFSPTDLDPLFASFANTLPTWHNTGLILRWESALANADAFLRTDAALRTRAIMLWANGARSLIRNAFYVTLCDDLVGCTSYENFASCIGECNSVVSFGMRVDTNNGMRYLTTDELRMVYKFLSKNLVPHISSLSEEERFIAGIPCIIGQPVQIGTRGTCTSMLRLAIGIPQILPVIEKERLNPAVLMDEILEDDRIVIQKLELIAKHWAELSS